MTKLDNKYSPNLAKWLKSKKRPQSVYCDPNGLLWIGEVLDGELHGAQLNAVLCEGARTQTFCYVNAAFNAQLEPVTDFWERYEAVGRCAIDPEHRVYFLNEDRYHVEGDTRTCKWCSEQQQKQIEVVTREVTHWVPLTNNEKSHEN